MPCGARFPDGAGGRAGRGGAGGGRERRHRRAGGGGQSEAARVRDGARARFARNRVAVLGAGILVGVTAAALLAPWLSPTIRWPSTSATTRRCSPGRTRLAPTSSGATRSAVCCTAPACRCSSACSASAARWSWAW